MCQTLRAAGRSQTAASWCVRTILGGRAAGWSSAGWNAPSTTLSCLLVRPAPSRLDKSTSHCWQAVASDLLARWPPVSTQRSRRRSSTTTGNPTPLPQHVCPRASCPRKPPRHLVQRGDARSAMHQSCSASCENEHSFLFQRQGDAIFQGCGTPSQWRIRIRLLSFGLNFGCPSLRFRCSCARFRYSSVRFRYSSLCCRYFSLRCRCFSLRCRYLRPHLLIVWQFFFNALALVDCGAVCQRSTNNKQIKTNCIVDIDTCRIRCSSLKLTIWEGGSIVTHDPYNSKLRREKWKKTDNNDVECGASANLRGGRRLCARRQALWPHQPDSVGRVQPSSFVCSRLLPTSDIWFRTLLVWMWWRPTSIALSASSGTFAQAATAHRASSASISRSLGALPRQPISLSGD